MILNGGPWRGRGAAGEIGHMVVRRNGRACTCGREGLHGGLPGRRAMELEARQRHEDGEKTTLFKIMEKKGRDARSRAASGPRRSSDDDKLAVDLIDRAVGRSAPASPRP